MDSSGLWTGLGMAWQSGMLIHDNNLVIQYIVCHIKNDVIFIFLSKYKAVLYFSVDFERSVYWSEGGRLLRDEACRPIHRRSESDEEDWRAPRGKRPPVAKINNSV